MIVILASRADEVNSRPGSVLGIFFGCAPAGAHRSILTSWCVTFQSASPGVVVQFARKIRRAKEKSGKVYHEWVGGGFLRVAAVLC